MKIKEWSIIFWLQLGHVLVSVIFYFTIIITFLLRLPTLYLAHWFFLRCTNGSYFQQILFASIFPLFSTVFTTFSIGVEPKISKSWANVG